MSILNKTINYLSIAAIIGVLSTLIVVDANRPEPPTPAAVRVETGLSLGSGFLISETQVMTAEHVVEGVPEGETVDIAFEGQKERVKATVSYKDKLSDVAILVLPNGSTTGKSIQTLDCRGFKRGEEVSHIGNPYGIEYWHSEGKVATNKFSLEASMQRWSEVNYLDISAGPGSSGGPVFGADGKVLGMMVGQHGRNVRFLVATPGNVLCAQRELSVGS